jgi:hypothetical protein
MSWVNLIKFNFFICKSFEWTACVESAFVLTTVQLQLIQWNLKIKILPYSLFINFSYHYTLKPDRQCTYNVMLRCVHASIVAVEKQWVLHNLSVCIYSLRYPARNAHAPYFHVRPFPVYNTFSTLSRKRHDFRKKVIKHKICVLIFSTSFVWNISHSKNKWERYDKKCILVFMYSTRYSCQILMKLKFSPRIFEKSSNIKFHENPSGGSRVVQCGWTDGQTWRIW